MLIDRDEGVDHPNTGNPQGANRFASGAAVNW